MSTNTLSTKSLLAKLMATENLFIEQSNVPTASFDIKNRILTVPILDNKISSELYDLFMGHEVGHALETPQEGLEKALLEEKLSRGVVNVVEDARIERIIKNKYPGLRNSFVKGYDELMDRNFFGIKGQNLDMMNLIDRINIHTKGGAKNNIAFSPEEREILNLVNSTVTFQDVIEVSRRIIDFMKKQNEEKREQAEQEEPDLDSEMDSDFFDDFGEGEEDDFGDEFGDSGSDDNYGNDGLDEVESFSSSSKHQQDSDYSGTMTGDSQVLPESDTEIRSFTDEQYKKNEKQLFEANAKKIQYCNIPTMNKEVIIDFKKVYSRYKEWMNSYNEESKKYYSYDHGPDFAVDRESYRDFRKENEKVVLYLVKEFELRKNASQLKRASIAKTGELEMKKLFSYKFSEDIFRKMTIVPDGKSHGLMMYVDWSGSMTENMASTIKQLFTLALFCKKVNIPFEVYAFSDKANYTEFENTGKQPENCPAFSQRLKDVGFSYHFCLYNLLSSRMNASEFSYAAGTLFYFSKKHSRKPYWLELHGTPLNETIVSAMTMVPEFQKKNKLEIVNTVFLTDGEANGTKTIFSEHDYGNEKRIVPKTCYDAMVLRDEVTKQEVRVNQFERKSMTSSLLKLLKARTNSNIVGFFIVEPRDFTNAMLDYFPMGTDFSLLRKEFNKVNSMVVTSSGFDEYYVLNSKSMREDVAEKFEIAEDKLDNMTSRRLASEFAKHSKSKLTHKVVLNRFVGLIS